MRKTSFSFTLYKHLFFLVIPLLLLRLWWKGRKNPAYRQRLGERLGYLPFTITQPVVWVHAVSLGEAVAATPFIRQWLAKFPRDTVLVTNTTPAGSAHIQKTFGDKVKHAYFPYDSPSCLARFFQRCRPRVLIVLETEIWPVLFERCHQQNIPVFIINGRISDKSWPQYQRIRPIMADAFQCVKHIFAQSAANGERFVELGLDPTKLTVMGNLKFDVTPPRYANAVIEETKATLHATPDKPRFVLVAASTHAGEEQQLLDILPALQKQIPNLLLVLIPRHQDRFNAVAALVTHNGFSLAQRTTGAACAEETIVYLADTMGEVPLFYMLADVAFVGGSLVPIGGHSLLEPTFAGLPVVTGPHNENALEIAQYLKDCGILSIGKDKAGVRDAILELAKSPGKRAKCRESGLDIMRQHQGASEKTQQQILALL